jgi:hypothetical protein
LAKVSNFQNAGAKLTEEKMGFGGVRRNKPAQVGASMPEI